MLVVYKGSGKGVRSNVPPVGVKIFLAVVLIQALKDAQFIAFDGLGAVGDLILG